MDLRIGERLQGGSNFRNAWDVGLLHLMRTVPHPVRDCKPSSVHVNPYRFQMAQDPRTFLWANICELMGGDDVPTIDAVQKRTTLGRGTVQRIREGDAATRISSIHTVAEHLGVEVWQLLMPPDVDQLAVIEAAARKRRLQIAPSIPQDGMDKVRAGIRARRDEPTDARLVGNPRSSRTPRNPSGRGNKK